MVTLMLMQIGWVYQEYCEEMKEQTLMMKLLVMSLGIDRMHYRLLRGWDFVNEVQFVPTVHEPRTRDGYRSSLRPDFFDHPPLGSSWRPPSPFRR